MVLLILNTITMQKLILFQIFHTLLAVLFLHIFGTILTIISFVFFFFFKKILLLISSIFSSAEKVL